MWSSSMQFVCTTLKPGCYSVHIKMVCQTVNDAQFQEQLQQTWIQDIVRDF